MRKSIFTIIIILFSLGVNAQDTNQNYTKSITYKKPSTQGSIDLNNPEDAVVQVSYYDGLGRPIQQIAHKQSNTGKDIVTHIEYDQFGRQTKEFLPYATSAPSLSYIDATTAIVDLYDFYTDYNGGTSNPFSEKLLENSPLSRVFKQAAPGDDWALGNGHEIKFDYQTNISKEVKLFKAKSQWNGTTELYEPTFEFSGHYQPNELIKTIIKDENWKPSENKNSTTEEFKDKGGRIVLKRTYNNDDQHDTYYIYDQYGNLTYVLPPLASDVTITSLILNDLCYQYKYDYRNRLVEKKLPGKDWEYIVYNHQNMPVATGPVKKPWGSTSESEIGWLITKYDAFGRVVYTGYYTGRTISSNDRKEYQTEQSGLSIFNETISNSFVVDGMTVGYTNKVLPISNFKILSINYYDSYDFPYAPNPMPDFVEGQPVAAHVKTLPVGAWIRILDDESNNQGEVSHTLYDEKYRPIRTYTTNYFEGFTQVDSKLDWAGKILYTVTSHAHNEYSTPIVITDTFEYTQQDRLQTHKQQINQLDEQLISANTYDELGQLVSKNVGGTDVTGALGLQKVDYTYNIRGWLKGINDINDITTEEDLFAFRINYNDNITNGVASSGVPSLYNGNISETFWKTASDNHSRKYEYSYDDLNRLLQADYVKGINASYNSYLEKITYDKNGNILSLLRNGDNDTDGTTGVQEIDNLVYTYHSDKKNQLMKVLDLSNSPQGFSEIYDTDSNGETDNSDDYAYDSFGNMTRDDNKGITNIKYNHLNLPTEIEFGYTGKIEYFYNATGQKVIKIVTDGSNITQHEYLAGGFQYKNSVLKFFTHSEGYVNATEEMIFMGGATYRFNYVFNYTDHLGNIRLSYGVDPSTHLLKIMEENHYYPFGLKHTNYNSDQLLFVKTNDNEINLRKPGPSLPVEPSYKYKYNGKEYQDELGLNMYDYHARNYDPALGRWMNIDPLAENSRRWTPYNYAYSNPMYFIDPDGMQAIWKPDPNGNLIAQKGDNVATLAKYLGTTTSDITNRFKKVDSKGNKTTLSENHKFKENSQVTLNNSMSKDLKDYNDNGKIDNLNCHCSVYPAVNNLEITNDENSKISALPLTSAEFGGSKSKEFLNKFTKSESIDGAKFGKTVAVFDDGETEHSAVYYGQDDKGVNYFYNKQGANGAPVILTENQVKEIYGSKVTFYHLKGD